MLYFVLCFSMFLYCSFFFSGNLMVYRLANSAFFLLYVSLFISWHLVRHMYFLASIWLQLLKCSGLARTLYPVSSWLGTWKQHWITVFLPSLHLVLSGVKNSSFLSWIFSIFLYSSLLVSKRLFEAFWVANNLYIIHYNSITKKIFKHVNLS